MFSKYISHACLEGSAKKNPSIRIEMKHPMVDSRVSEIDSVQLKTEISLWLHK